MLEGAPPGSQGFSNWSGWMKIDLFLPTVKHFIKLSNSSQKNPSILILDNHKTHTMIEAGKLTKENGVHLLTLLPHTSGKIQPFDVGVLSSFKAAYNLTVDSRLLRNVGRTVTIYDIAKLVCQVFDKSRMISNIKAGFRKSGIYMYDRDAFHEDEFITHIKKKYEGGAIFLHPSDKSTKSQENLSHSTTSTLSIPTNYESNSDAN